MASMSTPLRLVPHDQRHRLDVGYDPAYGFWYCVMEGDTMIGSGGIDNEAIHSLDELVRQTYGQLDWSRSHKVLDEDLSPVHVLRVLNAAQLKGKGDRAGQLVYAAVYAGAA